MAVVHLIHGYTGAGKTTFARRLESESGALRISVDEWYLRLFVEGTTHHLEPALMTRLVELLDELWPSLCSHGVDVILDFGFWSRSSRDHARALAATAGAEPILYHVVCDDEVARERLLSRDNAGTGSFRIDEQAYNDLRSKYEPLGPDEDHLVIDSGQLFTMPS